MRIKYNTYGSAPITKFNSNGDTVFAAAYFCPHCGSEIYSQWNFYKGTEEHQLCKQESNQFFNLSACPLCTNSLLHEAGYFMQSQDSDRKFFKNNDYCVTRWTGIKPLDWHYDSYKIDSIFSYLQKIRIPKELEKTDLTISQLLKKIDVVIPDNNTNSFISNIKKSPIDLQNHLNHIFQLESNIYAIQKRLTDLYNRKTEISRMVVSTKYESVEYIRKETANTKLLIQTLTEALYAAQTKPLTKANVTYPQRPIAPVAPLAPVLGTPGLFNKKKILAENESKRQEYILEMNAFQRKQAAYEEAVAQYERQYEECRNEETRQNEENRQKRDSDIQKAQAALNTAQAKYDEFKATEESRIAEAIALPVPADVAAEILDKEICEAESLLKELFIARNTLYSYNVVFQKYRNIVALSTFSEYLKTGRCTTLEGPDGAYNLYESECRADMIISQLSIVIESLEQIKQTQYTIYNELQDINSSLANLNSTMNSALKSIQSIDATTEKMSIQMNKIAENTDIIAHNTAVTAYYSKINADLTNALGYMVAFK